MILSRRFKVGFTKLIAALYGEEAGKSLNQGEALYESLVKKHRSVDWVKYNLECLKFLVTSRTLENGFINLFDQEALAQNQHEMAPLCNTGNDYGVIAFADGFGLSEGDLWVLDANDGKVGRLSLGAAVDTYEALKKGIYLEFHDDEQWLNFLAVDAFRRGWIDVNLLREVVC